jgi:hypothetical protein
MTALLHRLSRFLVSCFTALWPGRNAKLAAAPATPIVTRERVALAVTIAVYVVLRMWPPALMCPANLELASVSCTRAASCWTATHAPALSISQFDHGRSTFVFNQTTLATMAKLPEGLTVFSFLGAWGCGKTCTMAQVVHMLLPLQARRPE